jgi:hypothetical protein
MKIPAEFREAALLMHQDLPQFVSMADESELIDYLTRGVSPENANAAAAFIDRALTSGLTDTELAALWLDAGADWRVSEHGIVHFLTMLRDSLRG